MSLRRRVLVGFVVVAVVLIGSNVVLSSTFHAFLLSRVDRQLLDLAARPLVKERFGGPRPGPGEEGQTLSEYFIAVGHVDDSALTRLSTGLDSDPADLPRLERAQLLAHLSRPGTPLRPYTVSAESGRGSWRLVAAETGRAGAIAVLGISLDELRATLARIRLVQLAGTTTVLAALGVVWWWMVRLGVRPLASMAETADAIAAGEMSRRVEHADERTEVGRLGSALNAMLERIEDAFRAREASEARVRRFAADASHELRTPLTSIRGYTELWRAGGLRGEGELDDAMRRLEQEARRMGALVEDLLLLARLDQRRPVSFAPLALDALVADGVRDARAVEPDRPITFEARAVQVQGDEGQLRQVVANLLSNVRVHTPPGTPVTVTVTADATTARLTVADQGPGIEPAAAAKVFERFFRADPSRARSAGGTGLGLAIVAAVAEAHGGRAGVQTRPGKGATFTVELPVAGPGPAFVKPPEASGASPAAAAGGA
ncbi:MAG TPA: HAMP domain-containing sensor histidine kinase [Acidimicrobiales bacterium]|nr:HAMP domain-containing sensor histidine kinase [Acidimicrobiales bacterium]